MNVGLALLGEGLRAFFGVVGAEDRPAELELVGEGLVSPRLALSRRLLQHGLDGEGAVGGDLVGELPGLGERLAVGDDVADEADLLGLGGGHLAAGEEQLGGDRVRDLAAESHRRAAEREQAAADLGDAEDGALPRHPQVHRLQDLGAAGDGVALDRGDQRLARLEVAQQRLPVEVGVGVEAGVHSSSG